MTSLTKHLLSLDSHLLEKATTHPFLKSAAIASLPRPKLIHWLAQDRLYALSYVNFIGSLLSQLHIPTSSSTQENKLEWRLADSLIDCLTNIRREIHLFEDTARDEGFLPDLLEAREERPTRCYKDLFAGATAGGKPTVVGLVVLWASEVCYLKAWKHARQFLSVETERQGDVMQRVFIPNWSDDEFEKFVGRLGELVDAIEVEEGGVIWRECENAFKQVLWVEGEFWPEI